MIDATITGDTIVLARLERLSGDIRTTLLDTMRREWLRLQAAVVTEKLSGDPLRRRTGVLASSINVGGTDTASEFVEGDTEIVGRVGTKVRYGKPHEEGGEFAVPAHTRTVTQVFGRPVAPHPVEVSAYTAHFRQRSFLRSTIRDKRAEILERINAAVAEATRG